MRLFALLAVFAPALSASAAPRPFPQFKVQEIDKTLKVGYGLRVVDLNKDGKLDVVVADAARVVWFDNAQDWKLRTIIDNAKAGVKPDNVCLDVADIDGDGKLDVALGADWQPNNTKDGGSLQWLRQGKTIDEWTVHPIAAPIPTLHRIHFFRSGGLFAGPALIVVPLKGTGSAAAANFMDVPVKILTFVPPADPTGKWAEPTLVSDATHVTHNVRELPGWRILTASYEGVGVLSPANDWPPPRWSQIGAGNQDNPKGSRGSGEVAQGHVDRKPAFVAAIEPFHGHQVVAYTGDPAAGKLLTRTVIDEQLKSGHALWCADLDGDGTDEIVAGFRDPTDRGVPPGVNVYRMAGDPATPAWEKHVLDPKGMACEDLACADLNGDGKTDVVAAGRATGNVRIYWNQGMHGR